MENGKLLKDFSDRKKGACLATEEEIAHMEMLADSAGLSAVAAVSVH